VLRQPEIFLRLSHLFREYIASTTGRKNQGQEKEKPGEFLKK